MRPGVLGSSADEPSPTLPGSGPPASARLALPPARIAGGALAVGLVVAADSSVSAAGPTPPRPRRSRLLTAPTSTTPSSTTPPLSVPEAPDVTVPAPTTVAPPATTTDSGPGPVPPVKRPRVQRPIPKPEVLPVKPFLGAVKLAGQEAGGRGRPRRRHRARPPRRAPQAAEGRPRAHEVNGRRQRDHPARPDLRHGSTGAR